MATPWTFEQRLAAYRAEGITDIVVMSGAETHNRDAATGKAFGPVYGLTVHHTAGVSSGMKDVIYNGVSGLPGPLAQDFLAKDGTLYVVGHGRCNHAGSVTPAVKASIIAEREPNLTDRNIGSETEDGNDFLYGLEIENRGDGSDPYPAVQYDVAVRWAAAHLRHHHWGENSAWGHKEITGRKIDPSFNMDNYRANVRTQLFTPDEPPTPPQEDPEVPTLITGSNSIDVALNPSEWVPLALDGNGNSFIAGPTGALVALVTLYLATDTPADTKVQGVFYLTDPDGSNSSDYLVTDHRGGGGKQFVHATPVPAGKLLWFRVRAVPADGLAVTTLLHRDLKGHRFAA